MNQATFRTRLRRAIFDEDVRIEAIKVQREDGYIEVTETEIIGYSDEATEEWRFAFADYPTYNDLVYVLETQESWTIQKTEECVGSHKASLLRIPKRAVTDEVILYAKHFFHDDVLDDVVVQAIYEWNDLFNVDYAGAEYFPDAKSVPLLWVSASNALLLRAAQDTVSFYEYNQSGKITSVSLGGELSIAKQNIESKGEDSGGHLSWKALADAYRKKFTDYISTASDKPAFPEIQEVEKRRIDLDTGKPLYRTDEKLDPVINLTYSTSGSDVTLRWSPVYSHLVLYYEVWKDGVYLAKVYDNQESKYTDESVSGTHTYKVRVVNTNDLASDWASVEVTV